MDLAEWKKLLCSSLQKFLSKQVRLQLQDIELPNLLPAFLPDWKLNR